MAARTAPWQRMPLELGFSAAMLGMALLLAGSRGLPLVWPSPAALSAVGIHYFVPLLAIFVWYSCSALFGGMARLRDLTAAMLCYALVMWLHFNIKLWMPHLNPYRFDELYWRSDQAMRPLIEACLRARAALGEIIPNVDHFYLIGFVSLFFVSFCVHAVRSPAVFRKVLLAAILLQGLGALAYCIMPALGPFLYEQGANPVATDVQAMMLGVYRQSLDGGSPWLASQGTNHLVAGLAAMPSLHAGGSYLFLWFVARYEKPLLVLYVPVFCFILIEAVASRWHYVIDLPVGIALAQLCIFLAYRLDRGEPDAKSEEQRVLVEAAAPA